MVGRVSCQHGEVRRALQPKHWDSTITEIGDSAVSLQSSRSLSVCQLPPGLSRNSPDDTLPDFYSKRTRYDGRGETFFIVLPSHLEGEKSNCRTSGCVIFHKLRLLDELLPMSDDNLTCGFATFML